MKALPIILCAALFAGAARSEDAARLWAAHIRPLFADHCFKCHGNIEAKSGLSLMSTAEIFKGGDNGPVVVPGKPEKSSLYQNVLPGADPHMPKKDKQLPPEEIALIKRWIELLSPADAKTAIAAPEPKMSPLFHRLNWQPPAGASAVQAIDSLIKKRWDELRIEPSARCDDRTFVRRVYLDIAGRIPTPEEVERFLKDKSRNKRAELVDALLETPDYAQRMRDVFNVVFMERGPIQGVKRDRRNATSGNLRERWLDYLEWSFRENRPWNVMAREIVLARPEAKELAGAPQFLYARKDNAQLMAEATGNALLGLQIKCAQCHDHPLALEIKQSHYWGMVAAFNRSKAVDTAAGPGVAESAIGGHNKFTNLKGASTEARVFFLDGTKIEETWPKEGVKETETPEQYVNATPVREGKDLKAVPVPKYSRRELLANWITDAKNPLLAKAFVNRKWELLIGRGFVHPVDRLDSSRAASHPELLDWLAEDFAQNGYDVKRLIRTITATRAYQLDSRPAKGHARPPDDTFASAIDKPLTAEVFLRSMLVAVGGTEEDNSKPEVMQSLQRRFADTFPDVFALENESNPKQALFLSNNPGVDTLIKTYGAQSLARIAKLDEKARVKELFARALGREPDKEELKRSVAYLKERKSDPEGATRQVLWALLAGAEFRINH